MSYFRFERKMIIVAAACDGFSGGQQVCCKIQPQPIQIAGMIMLLNVLVFCLSCWSRDWLLYPNYNYLSWSFAMALGAVLSFLCSVICHIKVNEFCMKCF